MQDDRNSSVRTRRTVEWPLSKVLISEVHPAQTARIWGKVQMRLQGADSASPRARWSLAAGVGGAIVVALALVFGGLYWQQRLAPGGASAKAVVGAADAANSDGADRSRGMPLVLPPLMGSDAGKVSVEQLLADGSRITTFPGAKLRTLASTGEQVVLQLQSGKARFKVTPGGPRKWLIEAGVATVEVVGTEFTVERSGHGARVAVQHGVVLVRSVELTDGVERVARGDMLTVGDWEPQQGETDSETAAPNQQDPAPAPVEPDVLDSTVKRGEAASGAAKGEAVHGVVGAAPPQSSRARQARPVAKRGVDGGKTATSVERLLELADQARIAGDPFAARYWLQRVVDEHRKDPRAAISAFQLGVLELKLGMSSRAVESLQVALSSTRSDSLREDCYLRLVEAHLMNGARSGAESVAEAYLSTFPRGRHQRAIERLLARSAAETQQHP